MTRLKTDTSLEFAIAAVLSARERQSPPAKHRLGSPLARALACAGVSTLLAVPPGASALGIGEINLQSTLGQPLRATVPVSLAAGESLAAKCVSAIRPGAADSLGQPRELNIRVPMVTGPASVELQLSTARALKEPLYEIALQVQCQGLPTVLREYVVMLDLPGLGLPVTRPAAAEPAPVAAPVPAVPRGRTAGAAPRARALAASADPIQAGSLYRVRDGDTLSGIAARIEGRPAGSLWQVADLIHAANGTAFVNGNPDLIKLGAQIRIPGSFDSSAASTAPADLAPAPSPVNPLMDAPVPQALTPEPVTATMPAPAEAPASAATAAVTPAATSMPAVAAPAGAVVREPEPIQTRSPDPAVTPSPQLRPAAAPATPPVASPAATSSGTQPLLGVGLGLLLGLALSTLLLRTRFLDGLRARLSRGGGTSSPLAGAAADDTFDGTDEWRDAGSSSTRLAVGKPAEDNYVVEVSDIEPEEAAGQPADDAHEAATAQASPEDRMLDEIFDEDFGDVAGNLDLPEEAFTDEDMGTATDELAPTAAVQAMTSAAGADAPATGSTDAEPTSRLDIDFEVPDFELPDFDAEPATADLPGLTDEATSSLDLDFDLSGLDADAADPEPTAETSTEASGSLDLQSMVAGSTGNAKLSRTLEEALSLLERDYEDELTASQIIDRESLDAALKDSDAASDDDTRKRRKLTG